MMLCALSESYDDGNRGNVYQGNISPNADYQEYDTEERYKENPPPLRADDPCMVSVKHLV